MTEEETAPLVEKHRPETLDDIQGNNSDLKRIKKWAERWDNGDPQKPILLHGPPGTGKTSTAHALANEFGWELSEVNASSSRKTDDLNQIANQIGQASAMGERQIIFLDEVDSLSGQANFGDLVAALKDPGQPVIMSCNDEYEVPKKVKNTAKDYEFSLGVRSRRAKIRKIAEEEGLDLDAQQLKELSERPNLRDAIQDLQLFIQTGEIPEQGREYDSGPFDMLDDFMHGEQHFDNDMSPPEQLIWVDGNLRTEYVGVEAMVAYDALARADKWLGRVGGENYEWWRMASLLLDYTPRTKLRSDYDGYIQTQYPTWERKKWKGHDSIRSLHEKLYPDLPVNERQFREMYVDLLQDMPQETKNSIAQRYQLSDGERDVFGAQEQEATVKEAESKANSVMGDW